MWPRLQGDAGRSGGLRVSEAMSSGRAWCGCAGTREKQVLQCGRLRVRMTISFRLRMTTVVRSWLPCSRVLEVSQRTSRSLHFGRDDKSVAQLVGGAVRGWYGCLLVRVICCNNHFFLSGQVQPKGLEMALRKLPGNKFSGL